MNHDKIGVIIVTYNSEKWIANCLESLENSSIIADMVVVVDNDSKDRTLNCIPKSRGINIIALDNNCGFGMANNIGAKLCIESGCSLILLLNPDAKVKIDSIRLAIDTMNSNANAGIVGGVELEYGSDLHSRYTDTHSFKALKNNSILEVNGAHGQCINGAFALLRVEAIKAVGLFDPIYHLYFEESDLFRRFRFAHWSILLNPNIKYHHFISASFCTGSADSKYMNLNKLKAITASESIHRLTNPEHNIATNVLSLAKQVLMILWYYRKNLGFMKEALTAVSKTPVKKCFYKRKMDCLRDYRYYLEILFVAKIVSHSSMKTPD